LIQTTRLDKSLSPYPLYYVARNITTTHGSRDFVIYQAVDFLRCFWPDGRHNSAAVDDNLLLLLRLLLCVFK